MTETNLLWLCVILHAISLLLSNMRLTRIERYINENDRPLQAFKFMMDKKVQQMKDSGEWQQRIDREIRKRDDDR